MTYTSESCPLPVEDLFIDKVREASACILNNSDNLQRLSEYAFYSLQRHLLEQLVSLHQDVLMEEFTIWRQNNVVNLSDLSQFTEGRTNIYDEFIAINLKDEYSILYSKYPVLKILAGTIISNWIESTNIFYVNVINDWDGLIECGLLEPDTLCISDILCGLSDNHNNGKCVFIIETDKGQRVVYKPRDVSCEYSFNKLLKYLNQTFDCFSHKTFIVLSQTDHGWCETVNRESCESRNDLIEYYSHLGSIIALIYILGGTDFHNENIIASGNRPVVIDLETIISPNNTSKLSAGGLFVSGLLPIWNQYNSGEYQYSGGIGGVADLSKAPSYTAYKCINTNSMMCYQKGSHISVLSNSPVLDSVQQGPSEFIDDILVGFEKTYRHIALNKSHYEKIIPQLFHDARIRIVIRDTEFYSEVIQKSLNSKLFMNTTNWRDSLRANLSGIAVRNLSNQNLLLMKELEQISRLDIPYFSIESKAQSLCSENNKTIVSWKYSPLNNIENSLNSLSEKDRCCQLNILSSTIGAVRPLSFPQKVLEKTESIELKDIEDIATIISDLSLVLDDNNLEWLTIEQSLHDDKAMFMSSNLGLYNGLAGIGVFLSALTRKTLSNQKLNSLAYRLYNQLSSALLEQFNHKSSFTNGMSGNLSVLYCIAKMDRFLNQESSAIFQKIKEKYKCSEISDYTGCDIQSGSAGNVLTTLAIYEHTQDDFWLNLSILYADQIIDSVKVQNGLCEWGTDFSSTIQTGFSHGNSGISLALLRLWNTTKDKRLESLALNAIRSEDQYFDKEERNWRDLRHGKSHAFMNGWCNGAPGIILSRLEMSNYYSTCPSILRKSLDLCEVAIKQSVKNNVNSLCCGSFSMIEPLFRYDEEHANRLAVTLLKNINSEDFHLNSLAGLGVKIKLPGFFLGLSGVGYALLRLSDPELYPSILTLD